MMATEPEQQATCLSPQDTLMQMIISTWVSQCIYVADTIVNGRLKRIGVSSALSAQLKTSSPKERVSIYTGAILWYETLTALAEFERSNLIDTQVKADWANVLQLVDLPKNAPHTWTTYLLPNRTENSSRN